MKPIDSDRLRKEISKSNDAHATNGRERALLDRNIVIIDEQPIVECQPVIHTHWIVNGADDMDNEMYHCSNCGEEQFFSNYYGEEQEKFPYCPMCVAKMDEKVD